MKKRRESIFKRLQQTYFLLFCLLFSLNVSAQDLKRITGTVVDSQNEPAIGATVAEKGTTRGTATDIDGNFGLSVGENAVLVVSYIGYTAQEVPVGNQTNLRIVLKENTHLLNEVVVIGYGSQKKQDLTGSVASVTADRFNTGVVSPASLIQGKTPGVNITTNSGQAGTGAQISIRGGSSLTGSNAPLIVINGVPMDYNNLSGSSDPLLMINPNDIESFSVLKDAAASAIYGNRAANGVIIITTKKGKLGKLQISLNTNYSSSVKEGEVNVLNGDQFRAYINQHFPDYSGLLGTENTDWQSLIYRAASGTDNNLNFSGGIGELPYRLSLGYTYQDGIVKTNSYNRTSLGLNLSPLLFKKSNGAGLKVDFNFQGSFARTRWEDNNAIGQAVNMDPTQPVYSTNESGANTYFNYANSLPAAITGSAYGTNSTAFSAKGNPNIPYGGFYENMLNGGPNINATDNPLALLQSRNNAGKTWRALTSLNLDYRLHFLPDLHAIVNLALDYQKGYGTDAIAWWRKNMIENLQGGTRAEYMQEKWNKLFNGYLNYVKTVSPAFSMDLMAGYEWQMFREYSPIDQLPDNFTGSFPDKFYYGYTFYGNPNYSPAYYVNQPQDNRLNLQSFFGRAIFNFWDKYILTGTVRRDGSSRFYNGTLNNVWGNFPTASLAWKIKQESFLKNVDAVSDLKLRLGWGQTGNQNIGNYYVSFAAYNKGDNGSQYQFGNSFYNTWKPTQYNPLLTWETTTSENIGLDYGFWNNRIYGSIDYYQKQGKDMLMNVMVPPDNSFSNNNNKNIGQLDTKGWEFAVSVIPIQEKNTTWELNFNASTYNTKVTKINGQADDYIQQIGGIAGGTGNMIGAFTVGQPRGVFWVYQQAYDASGKPLDGVYVDRNGDGKIDNADKYYISSEPKATLGFSTKLSVQRWDFSLSCRSMLGNKLYNNFAGGSSIAQYNSFLNNVSGVSADYAFSSPQYWSDIFVENASFFRMDNMTLGYNFGSVCKGISNLRAYLQAQNVFVITKYKGIDPEIPGNNGTALIPVDNNFYPRPRVYMIGFNIQF